MLQAIGIVQVNEAVINIDSATQETAALAQQSAVAAGAVHQRTERLKRTVRLPLAAAPLCNGSADVAG